jgi:hypothetical protein
MPRRRCGKATDQDTGNEAEIGALLLLSVVDHSAKVMFFFKNASQEYERVPRYRNREQRAKRQ